MKYLKFFVIVISLFCIFSRCFASSQNKSKQNLLSGNEIDLLVGTPEGVGEPLDSRRNTITKDNKVDYSKFLDDDALTEDTNVDFVWKDAEEVAPSENQVENQLMDLLAETEELEKIDEIYYKDDDCENASESWDMEDKLFDKEAKGF